MKWLLIAGAVLIATVFVVYVKVQVMTRDPFTGEPKDVVESPRPDDSVS